MLIRISLIVAIVAALAVGALNFVKVKEIIVTTRAERDSEKSQKEEAQNNLRKTTKELETTKTDLKQTQDTLASTTKERDAAVLTAAAQVKRATQLAEELDTNKKALETAQADLAAYKGSGFTPEQVANLGKTLKQAQDGLAGAQDENKVLGQKIKKLETELAIYKTPDYIVVLPASLKGKVLVSDPKWEFVVLDVGEDQGVLEHGELLVNRDGRLVAKIRVTNVQKDRSIANVMPGWKLGELLEGDQVIPAHPAS